MKTAIVFIALIVAVTSLRAQVVRPVTRERMTRPVRTERSIEDRARIADTVPGRVIRNYRVDNDRYRRYLATNLNDSVKMPKATATDWNDYEAEKARLETTLEKDPYNNVSDYINRGSDFESLQLVVRAAVPNAARVCLRQLTFNLNVVNNLLNARMDSEGEPKLLGRVIRNIDTLCLSCMVPYVSKMMSAMVYPKILFQVVDGNNVERKDVTCYLVTPKVCRDISCKTCKISTAPCGEQAVAGIVNQGDYTFDCANPKTLNVAPGVYHLFVVEKNKVIDYQFRTFDANDIEPGAQPKTIKIALQ